MEGTVDPFDFILAQDLNMTLGEVRQLSNNEWMEWKYFYAYKQAMQEVPDYKG